MNIQVYQMKGKIEVHGIVETQFVQPLEECPEEIVRLFKVSTLTMVALQIDTGNGIVSAVYKKVVE